MKKYLTIAVIASSIFVSAMVFGVFSSNSLIHAKPEQGQSSNSMNKIVAIHGYDGARQTFIITQVELAAIQSNLVDSSMDTNSSVNATLENVEDFLLKHASP